MRWLITVVLPCFVLLAPFQQAVAQADYGGCWRLVSEYTKVLEFPIDGYTGTHSEKAGQISISEAGEYSMTGSLVWKLGPPDVELPCGKDFPFSASYSFTGNANSYGLVYYGFSTTATPEERWWKESFDAPRWFSSYDQFTPGMHTFKGSSILVPMPPKTGEKYMYIGAAAIGQYVIQVFYFQIYQWSGDSAQVTPDTQPKIPCKESTYYYGLEVAEKIYTGTNTQVFTRDQLVSQIENAVSRYVAEGNSISDGTSASTLSAFEIEGVPVPVPESVGLCRAFDTAGLPTGNEDALRALIAAKAEQERQRDPDYRLTPEDVFYLSLQANQGNIRNALCCCHAALGRNFKKNATMIDNYLCKLRNPEGYKDCAYQYYSSGERVKTLNPRTELGNDEQGVWYHLFGMAAVQYTDAHNFAPYFAVQQLSFLILPANKTEKAKREGIGHYNRQQELAELALALEDSTRSNYNAPPDPDKMCINFSGAYVGMRLRELINEYEAIDNDPSYKLRTPDRITFTKWHRAKLPVKWLFAHYSPLNITITGTEGETFSFDQTTKVFNGNTPNVLFVINPEEDGTWGLAVAPQFEVADVQYTATGTGPASVLRYDYATGKVTESDLNVKPGDTFTPEQLAALQSAGAAALGNQAPGGAQQTPQPAGDTASSSPVPDSTPAAGNPATTTAPGGPGQAGTPSAIPGFASYDLSQLVLLAPDTWIYSAEDQQTFASWVYLENDQFVAGIMLVSGPDSDAVASSYGMQLAPGGVTDLDGLSTDISNGTMQDGSVTVTMYSMPVTTKSWVHLILGTAAGRENEFATTFQTILGQLRIK